MITETIINIFAVIGLLTIIFNLMIDPIIKRNMAGSVDLVEIYLCAKAQGFLKNV